MAENVAVQFITASAPYEAGDVAGFPALQAQGLVDRRVADFWPPSTSAAALAAPVAVVVDDQFTGMDRAALIAFAREHLGLHDEPPADVTDDALRGILRDQLAAAEAAPHPAAVATDAPPAAAQPAPADGAKGATDK